MMIFNNFSNLDQQKNKKQKLILINKLEIQMIPKVLRQCYGILVKNFLNHWANKKKLLGQFIFPVFISCIYVLMQKTSKSNPIIALILGVLLKMYIALIGIAAVKETVILFLNEKQKKFRQYQMIFSLGTICHTLSNLLYMAFFMSFFLMPFYFTVNSYQPELQLAKNFAAFIVSTLSISIMLSSFFTDQKLATQFIGMLFSLSSFLIFLFTEGKPKQNGQMYYTALDYIIMFMPHTRFAISIMFGLPALPVYSIYLVPIYLIVYSLMEFSQQWKESICEYWTKIKNWCLKKKSIASLTQEFSVGNQTTETQKGDDIFNQDSQNIMVKISNLVKTYKIQEGQFHALNHINMTINKRQIFGLLGRNGAGKTTLVDILTGLLKPTSGSYSINFENKPELDLGICYQEQILYDELTVQQHLYLYCRIKGINNQYKDIIDQIVNMLKIKDQFFKKVKELSGGNKRKLSIAIAVLGHPELIIFDEPTSGLDPLSRRSVWQILQLLKRNFNCSIILTTHHLDEAEVLSDWICVIQKGLVIAKNSPNQIKLKYGNGYYLTLQLNSIGRQQQIFSSVTTKLDKILKKVKILSKQGNRAKIFIKLQNFISAQKEEQWNQNLKFEEKALLSVLEQLDLIEGLKIEVQKNSLEQSFIALLKDAENGSTPNDSQESVELINMNQRPNQQRKTLEEYQNQSTFSKLQFLSNQTFGIFLRCVYFNKGNLFKFFITYNINIFILLIAMIFNMFLNDVIGKNLEQWESARQKQNSYSMLILQGYIIMAGVFLGVVMYEKEKNIRRVLNSRGVWPIAYWSGTFIFDFGCYLINLLIMTKLITPQSFLFLKNTQRGLLMLIELGIGIILYAYAASILFTKMTTANAWFSIINTLIGFIFIPMVIIGSDTFFGYFSFVKYFYPYYDLNVILIKKTMTNNIGSLKNAFLDEQERHYIWFSILIYLTIICLVQIRVWDRLKEAFWIKTNVEQNPHTIQLQQITKKYGHLEALKNITYYVGNQRLALLGHNGAGKSTTFSLLSGQINPTSGKLFLQNKSKLNYEKIMRSAGICYQQDCLWQTATPSQIFHIFSYLVPIQNCGKQIEWLYENLQFQNMNVNKRFQNLSGGNKRKICMAVALYGDPMIRLLDECSTGLDPSSRVAMIETIKHSGSGSTIFTTHSMGQAQELCAKTVIMSKGQVKQFDYIYKLKQKYYNCFWIDVIFMNFELDLSNSGQDYSFFQNNIELIKGELKKSINQINDFNQKRKNLQKKLPRILKENKQRKIRIQFDTDDWPIHIALKAVYALRHKLEERKKMQIVQMIYISQPRLQDVYIRLTKQNAENGLQQQENESKVYSLNQDQQLEYTQQYKPVKYEKEIQLLKISS